MKTTLFISLLTAIIICSCKPAGKIQKTTEIVSKVDTTAVVKSVDNKTVDSATLIREVYNKVIKNKINFSTFNAKVKVAYADKDGGDDATAFIRVKNDSAIWLSLRGPLGIEGARVLITRDSVKIVNLLKKYVQCKSINYLNELSGLPLDFFTLQDLVVGNPVFIDSNINSYKTDSSNYLRVSMVGKIFKNLITIENTDYKIIESKLEDIDVLRNRKCDIFFSGYDSSAGVPFSTDRKITLSSESPVAINLNFKQYAFNQPVTFPFNIPDNYKTL